MGKFIIILLLFAVFCFAAADKEYSEKRYHDHTRHMEQRFQKGDEHLKNGNYGQAARNYVSAAGHAINKAKHDARRK